MEVCKYIKNDVTIIQEKINHTYVSDLLSWQTTYLNNDIKVLKFNNIDNTIDLGIYFDYKFNKCKLNLINFSFEMDSHELLLKMNEIKSKSENLYSFFDNLSSYLNLINEEHDKYEESSVIVDTPKIEVDFEWDPYLDLDIKSSFSFNSIKLKQKAYEYYQKFGFNSQELKITKEHITNIIIKELETMDNNSKFNLIINDNMFDFDIVFLNFDNENLNSDFQKHNINGIKMNIKLNQNLYPYFPPDISFKNKLDNNLHHSISTLSYFDKNSWNPTNSLLNMANGIHKILEDNASITYNIDQSYEDIDSLIQNIININNICTKNQKLFNINLDYVKISKNEQKDESKYWNSGVGYGYSGRGKWNINEFIKEQNVKSSQNFFLINQLLDKVKNQEKTSEFHNFIINSCLFNILYHFIEHFNLVETDKNFDLFDNIYNILFDLDILSWNELPTFELSILAKYMKSFCDELNVFIKINSDISNSRKDKYNKIISYFNEIKKYYSDDKQSNLDEYCNIMTNYQFDGEGTKFNKFYYKNDNEKPNKLCISKFTKELATYNSSLPINIHSSIFVRYDMNDIRNVKALIIGPKDTPYENGCFIFDILIPNNYPNEPPKVNLQTTGNGTVRFNPNLYNSGKVCLSLLGTWSGELGEKWNKDTSTLLQVLVSIQSLIFVENPYFNEPGYEKGMHTELGKNKNFKYNDNIRYNTIKWAINDNITDPCPEFKDLIFNHFKLKKDEINKTINEWYSITQIDKNSFNTIKNNCLKLLEKI